MLRVVGASSLDELIDQTIPGAIRMRRPLALPPARGEHELLEMARGHGAEERAVAQLPRHGLLGLHHAAGHPAQRDREPGLVHAVHAVPGRDLAGAARGAAQLPDDGERSDGARGRQRVAARRGHGRRRGDAHDGVVPGGGRPSRAARLRAVPPADDRRHPHARRGASASRWSSATRGPSTSPGRSSASCCSTRRPTARSTDWRQVIERRTLGRSARRDGVRPAGARARRAAGRARGRHRGRQRAAVRRAAGLRRAARGVLRVQERARAQAAGAHHRRERGRARQARPPHGAADARAAHPPREGDEQRVHGAGAAGERRRLLRRVPRAEGHPGHRRARPRPHGGLRARPGQAGGPGGPRALLRHAAHRGRRAAGRCVGAGRPRPQHEPAADRRPVARRRAGRDDVRRRGRRAARRVQRRTRPGVHVRDAREGGVTRPRGARAHERVPDAPGLLRRTTPRRRCSATSTSSSRATCRWCTR